MLLEEENTEKENINKPQSKEQIGKGKKSLWS